MNKTLKIISPTEARELNPLGEEPERDNYIKGNIYDYLNDVNEWQAAEASLKTYRIVACKRLKISSKPLTNEVVDWIMYKCSEFEEIYGEVLIVNIEVKNLQGRLIS